MNRTAFLSLGVLLFSTNVISGEIRVKAMPDDGVPFIVRNEAAGNGISVLEPKVFDRRWLTMRLEELDQTLARLTFIDQAAVAANVNKLQGYRKSEVARSLSVSTLPVPGTQLTEKFDTNSAAFRPDSQTTTSTEYKGAPPALDAVNFPAVADTAMGLDSEDILRKQVNLTYQIVNLRTLLDSSVTDRMRGQAVIGFNVNLQPTKQHRNQAAIVEVEVKSKKGKRPSLVSLIPKEKTYNVASISQKSTSFSGSAVVKIISIGYSQRNSGQTYFLHQDADTLALTRPHPETAAFGNSKPDAKDRGVVFGWIFRPVLNLESVRGGERELLAVISADELKNDDAKLDIIVRTYWVDYDKKRALIDSGPREGKELTFVDFEVPSENKIHSGLAPEIKSVKLSAFNSESAMIDVEGDRLFTGTSVVLGNRVFPQGDPALIIKSDKRLQVAARPSDLVSGQAFLTGRYGGATQLEDLETTTTAANMPDEFNVFAQFWRTDVTPVPRVKVVLRTDAETAPDLKGKAVVISIGTNVFIKAPGEWAHVTIAAVGGTAATSHLEFVASVPEAVINRNPIVTAAIPFLGRSYQRSVQVYAPQSVDKAVIIRAGKPNHLWGIVGKGFDYDIKTDSQTSVVADQEYKVGGANPLHFRSEGLITFEIDSKKAEDVKTLLVTLGNNVPFMVPAPKVTPPAVKMAVTAGQTLTVGLGDVSTLEFVGENFGELQRVTFDGDLLRHTVGDDPKKVTVFLIPKVTEKPGNKSLLFEGKDGTINSANVQVK